SSDASTTLPYTWAQRQRLTGSITKKVTRPVSSIRLSQMRVLSPLSQMWPSRNSYQTGVISGELLLLRVVRIAASFSSKKPCKRGPIVNAIVETPFDLSASRSSMHAQENHTIGTDI